MDTIYHSLNDDWVLAVIRFILSYLLCLVFGKLYLVRLRNRYADKLDEITHWQALSVFYYTFMYTFLGSSVVFGLMICGIPMLIFMFLDKNTRVFWIYLVPMCAFIVVALSELRFTGNEENYIATLWMKENRVLGDFIWAIIDSLR